MAARRHALQGYNFPFCGEENVSQSFVDYGSPSMLNIDIDQGQKPLIHSNQSDDSQLQRLAASQPSLPFLVPNQRSSSIPEETLTDYQFRRRSCKQQISVEKCGVQVENFSADRRDIMYSSIAELVYDDMNCHPWKTCGLFKSNSSLPWKQKENSCRASCKLCFNFGQACKNQNSNAARVVKHLSSALPDISPALLYSLFQESHALEIPRFQYDTFLGNSLACNSLGTDHQGLLMYPSGPGLEVFNFSYISQCCKSTDFENVDDNSSPLKAELSKQRFVVQGRIRQIDFASYSHSNIIVGIRSQYHCSFFQSCPSACGEGDKIFLKPLQTLALTKQAMCITVSPYIPGEAITVTETGRVYLWSCEHSLRTVHQNNHVTSNDFPWYQCVFAANPRCIAMADAKGMDLLDFREKKTAEVAKKAKAKEGKKKQDKSKTNKKPHATKKDECRVLIAIDPASPQVISDQEEIEQVKKIFQRLFFSIPSSEVDSFECISAIQRHPQNTHHYILATDQSLLILDDRFLHHPVLKWRHHNEDPVQFISVACNVIPECSDTILVISGSKNRQTHCFQYSDSQVQVKGSFPITTEQQCLPPQSTSLPWKVSSYNEWYFRGLSSDPTFSPATASRLSQPLIGVCTMPHTSHPQMGFTVFQMSSTGDLFYQPFVSPQDDKDLGGSHFWNKESVTWRSNELGSEAKIFCQKWINITNLHNDNFLKTAPFQVEYVETDKKVLCQNLTSLLESHSCCVLCNDRPGLENTELDQTKPESDLCQRCGVQMSYSANLLKNQQIKGALTRNSLSLQYHVEDLGIFPDLKKVTDPLSKSLWVNWNSNEPIAVSLSGDQETENQPDIQGKTVEPWMTLLSENVTSSTSISNSNIVNESSPQKQNTPSKSQVETPKVKIERKQNRHVMGF